MPKLLTDPCCGICRSNTGICLSRGTCDHHVDARRRQDANDRAMTTHKDPTGNKAVNNVMRAQRKQPSAPKRPFNYPKEER